MLTTRTERFSLRAKTRWNRAPDPGLLIVAHLAPGRSVYGLSRIEQRALYREDTVAVPKRPQPSGLPANSVSGAPLPARILIVDDNSVVRTTIRSFLNWHSLRVCGEAADGKEAIQKVRELKPDIVLLDINMPGMNGVKTAYEIRRVSPRTKIVFLTVHNTPGTVNAARMWVDGFVPKSTAGTVLIPTLSRVSEMLGYRPLKRSKARRATAS